jgi:hypothetical protein
VQATVADAFGSAEVRAPAPATGNLVWAAPAGDPRPGCETAQADVLGLPARALAGTEVEIAGGRVLTDDRNPADSLDRD